jgi:hypothetical protein
VKRDSSCGHRIGTRCDNLFNRIKPDPMTWNLYIRKALLLGDNKSDGRDEWIVYLANNVKFEVEASTKVAFCEYRQKPYFANTMAFG